MDNKSNKIITVKEPEELILMKTKLSEGALKLSAYLISLLQPEQTVYAIGIKDYMRKFDKNIRNYEYIRKIAKDLTSTSIEFEDRYKKEFVMFSFVSKVKYKTGMLEVEFNSELLDYLLEVKEYYLKYRLNDLMRLNSKYAIRIYKILKNKYEKTKRFQKDVYLTLSLDELRNMLVLGKSYQKYSHLKEKVLEISKREINSKTDIEFDYEEIKTGRKVTHLRFKIKAKKNYENDKNPAYIKNKDKNERIINNTDESITDISQKNQDPLIISELNRLKNEYGYFYRIIENNKKADFYMKKLSLNQEGSIELIIVFNGQEFYKSFSLIDELYKYLSYFKPYTVQNVLSLLNSYFEEIGIKITDNKYQEYKKVFIELSQIYHIKTIIEIIEFIITDNTNKTAFYKKLLLNPKSILNNFDMMKVTYQEN